MVLGEVAVRIASRWVLWYDVEMWKYAQRLKRVSPVEAIGHEHLPNRTEKLMGVNLSTNSIGLRNREITPTPPPGTFRILALGDSLTLGWGVRFEDSFTVQLEKRLKSSPPPGYHEVEVINAGVGNYNTSQEVAYYLEHGASLKPHLVLVFYFVNDAEPTPRRTNSVLRHSALAALLFGRIEGVLRRFGFRGGTALSYYEGLYTGRYPGWEGTRNALRTLAGATRESGTALLLVLLPELHDLRAEAPLRQVYSIVANESRTAGIETLDTWPNFENRTPRDLWVSPNDAHPNAKAHFIIAEAVSWYLLERHALWRGFANGK